MPNMTVVNNATVVNASGDILFFARYPGAKNSTYFLTLSAVSIAGFYFIIYYITDITSRIFRFIHFTQGCTVL